MHVIQCFFATDKATEVQIQGRTARQGKSGTYSLILAESEVSDPAWLGLDPASLTRMPADKVYSLLCERREEKRAVESQKMEETLNDANALDEQSHAYFDALLEANYPLAQERLMGLHERLGHDRGVCRAGYHFVCCYDESGSMAGPLESTINKNGPGTVSMEGTPWWDLLRAHKALMKKVVDMPSACVSIIQFDNSARTVLGLGSAQQALGANLSIRCGGTRFQPALAEAWRLMRVGKEQVPNLTPVVLFMSDGVNWDGDCRQTIGLMQQEFQDMLFHAVIFNQPDSSTLRGMVAAASNGQFHVSIDGVKLLETFTAIASSLEYTGQR